MLDSDKADIQKKVRNYLENTKPYSKMMSKVRDKITDKVMSHVDMGTDVNHFKQAIPKVVKHESYRYAYDYLLTASKDDIKSIKPTIAKKTVYKIQLRLFRRIFKNKHLANYMYCNYEANNQDQSSFLARINKPYKHWAMSFLGSLNNKHDVVKTQVVIAMKQMRKHSEHLRWFEYVAIPVIVFALPEALSLFLITITGNFFKVIGAGVMLYASHFTTIAIWPRIVLSVIGDGIAYWINKKRDERA